MQAQQYFLCWIVYRQQKLTRKAICFRFKKKRKIRRRNISHRYKRPFLCPIADQYIALVLLFIVSPTRWPDACQDACQDIFIHFYKRIKRSLVHFYNFQNSANSHTTPALKFFWKT